MNHDAQKNYFEIAYRTGSDVWTHLPYHQIALKMMPPLPADSFILDLGVGRGIWLNKLVQEGYRVIGLDYIPDVIKFGNRDIKLNGNDAKARFIHGDVRDIPLADHTFDAVTDIGVLQHLGQNDWSQYISEIKRVLKPEGYLLNVSFSKETPRFLGFKPKVSETSSFEKFDVSYYFFSEQEVGNLFAQYGFALVDQRVENFDAKTDPGDSISLVFSLFKLL
jgi:ubiquinone/menaquinone biosynthesis C-methylase UbiE